MFKNLRIIYVVSITVIIILFSLFISKNKTYFISSSTDAVRFISFGDNPHVPERKVKDQLNMLITSINKEKVSLVIHVGDTLGGREPCTNSMINLQKDIMNQLNAPVLYTPGDNEWRDCYQDKKVDVYNNIERLDYIRQTHFSNKRTLGKNPVQIENQSKKGYPENARLMINNVAFISAHVIGGNNNYDPTNEINTMEYRERDSANISWIKDTFKKYERASAFVVAIHADMYSSKSSFLPAAYEAFRISLYEISNKYQKPLLILYGDSHEFKDFQPMPKEYPFIYAIENYGDPDIKALMIEVDASKNKPFYVVKVIKGESLLTWTLRNIKRVKNYLIRNFQKIVDNP